LFNEILYELINMNYTIVSIHCIVYEENWLFWKFKVENNQIVLSSFDSY
jgi:hypothetical protein